MQPTKGQIQAVKDLKIRTLIMPEMKIYERYIYPCCENETNDTPIIENAGDNTTLIQCPFGCGFIYIESWI
jgi:hypothetical protein